ncbi:ABC transporter substrate-binding protein [Paenibacillus sambharensis]|uniref:ABC transporter substrate-binding protein n=2 Tax=Paenibacillus sambharensis TaxID=1803190 RepID=A0A2W1LCL3_9BACL|nr:ABC transporter substrate-binding protein [Paenibacillus sambharensis]PZD95800.1 ABC transporter substrate-binding protein [Paenibacillus sambharensis]
MNWVRKPLVMIIMLSAMLVTACSSGNNGNQGSGNTNAGSAVNTAGANGSASAKEPVHIEFWYGLGGKLGEQMEATIKAFNESQDEVVVKGVVQGNYTETQQALQAAIASKKVPAAALIQENSWASKGYFAPLDDFIAADAGFNKDDFIPAFLEQGVVDGKQYFLPLYGTTQVLYYRKDMLEKAGLTPDALNTWESLSEAAKTMTVADSGKPSVYGWMPMWGRENMIDAALSRGGKMVSEDGKTLLIDSPEWIETWEQFRKWIHEDKIMAIHSGGQGWEYWYKTIDDVIQGRAAGYTGSSGDQGDLDFSIVAAHPQPGWEGHPAAPVASSLTAAVLAAAPAEQQEAAYKWLTFFSNTSNTAQWSINTGYIAVRKSALDDPEFKAFAEQNPQIRVPLEQAQTASSPYIDPTGGKINDALKIAADKVQIENIPAEKALKEAKEKAQKELDKVTGA